MNYQLENNDAVVRENRNYKKILKWLFWLIMIPVAVYGAYAVFMKYFGPAQIGPSDNPISTYGLNGDNTMSDINGQLFVAAVEKGEEDSDDKNYVYQLDSREGNLDLKSHLEFKSFVKTGDNTAIVIASSDINKNSQTWQPHLFNLETETLTPLPHKNGFNVRDLVVSQNGLRYAYSYQNTDDYSEEISNWNIAVHTMDSDELEIIEGATEPEWVDSSDELVIMKEDGLYRYKLGLKETSFLTDIYMPYYVGTDLAVNEVSKKIILTNSIPSFNVSAVLSLGTDESGDDVVTEVGRLISTDTEYTSPVVNLAGTAYGLMAKKMSASGTDSLFEKIEIQVRKIDGADPVSTTAMPEGVDSDSALVSWGE